MICDSRDCSTSQGLPSLIPRPSTCTPPVFDHLRSKTGDVEGLGMRVGSALSTNKRGYPEGSVLQVET